MAAGTMNQVFPERGRLAGVDYGTVRIGIAVTDPDRCLASPLEVYTRRSPLLDAEYFRGLVAHERLVGFVVGLPVYASGDESQKSLEARQFGRWLSEQTSLPVRFYDERYTSVQAEQYLLGAQLTKKRRKKRLDAVAAQILLAAYLENPSAGDPGGLDDLP